MSLHLILGGARSGKSRLAEDRARASGYPVTVIATARTLDLEMLRRVERHKLDRPSHWNTVEEPVELARALRQHAGTERFVVVDCLTLWLANLLDGAESLPEATGAEALPRFVREHDALLATLPELDGEVVLVANEIGLGLVPETPLGRVFRDTAGRLNQAVARIADSVHFVAAGLPLRLK